MEKLTKYTNTAHILKTNELVDKVNLLESEGGKIQKIKINNQDLPIAPEDKSVNIDLEQYAEDKDIFLYVGDSNNIPQDKLRENMIIIDPEERVAGEVIEVDAALSSTSINPIQNKAVKAEVDKINASVEKNKSAIEELKVNGGKIQSVKVNNKVLEVAEDKSVNIDLSGYSEKVHEHKASEVSGLASVATSGNYGDLAGKPTALSSFTNDTNFITKDSDITGNAATSTLSKRATSDAKGNIIDSTYAQNEDIYLYVGDSTQVPQEKMRENMVIIDPKETSWAENVPIATKEQAETGTDNIVYMSPLRTKEAIQKFAPLKTVNNQQPDSNGNVNVKEYTHPNSGVNAGTYRKVTVNAQGHVTAGVGGAAPIAEGGTGATTAEQALRNLGIATQTEAEAGIIDNKIMTPLRTKQAATKYCLPKNGGELSGPIVINAQSRILAKHSVDNDYLQLNGGSDYQKGAYLILAGKDYTNKGVFQLSARDEEKTLSLYGITSGKLTWDNKNIVRFVNGIPANDSGNVTISGAAAHNSIYRGKSLGASVTIEQWNAIKAGTFDDLYIGDYWTISGVDYVIAAFDYYLNTGDTICAKHHVTIVPRKILYVHVMNDTNITTGAYIGSKMYKSGLDQAKTTITNAFGSDHILTIRQLYTTTTNPDYGYGTAFEWQDDSIFLMNEVNVYGCYPFTEFYRTTQWGSDKYSIDNSQYPIFAFDKTMIHIRQSYWLRNVVSATSFALVDSYGRCNAHSASYSYGVRPAFNIYQS